MPLRPFLSSLNIGTDICNISRINAVFLKEPSRFLRRLFTPRELAIYHSRMSCLNERQRSEYIAGRCVDLALHENAHSDSLDSDGQRKKPV